MNEINQWVLNINVKLDKMLPMHRWILWSAVIALAIFTCGFIFAIPMYFLFVIRIWRWFFYR